MKQIIIILFLLINLNGISQITFTGVKTSKSIITNNEDTVVKKRSLNTTNVVTEEREPIKTTTTIIQNEESITSDKIIETNSFEGEFNTEKNENFKAEQTIPTITEEEVEKIVSEPASIRTEEVIPSKSETTQGKQEIQFNEPLIPSTEEQIISTEAVISTPEPSEVSNKKLETTEEVHSKKSSGIFFQNSSKEEPTKEIQKINKTKEVKTAQKPEKVTTNKKIKEPKSIEITTKKETTTKPAKIVETVENKKVTNNSSEILAETIKEKPANPKKGSWSLGLGVGLPVIIGDLDSRLGYGGSFTVQKAMGHVFSLRFQAIALEIFGRDNELVNNTYSNYKTRFTDYTLQGVFTLNNLNFYKKDPKVIYNLIAGGGLATRHNWIDRFDENAALYSYDAIPTGTETAAALNDLLDKNYESILAKDEESMSIKNTNVLPSIVFGAGVSIKLSKALDLNLETRMSHHFDDNLDAHQRGTGKDWLSFTSLGLTFKIPSKSESMLWNNPVYSKIEEIDELKKKVDEGDLLQDKDKDGIADVFDQDLNTPPAVAVDSRGIAADMDKDGVPDYKDAEPFTTTGAQVDGRGIALDADNDGIADILDLEPNTIPGKQVDANGKTINTAADLANIENNSDFDLIFFDENSYKVRKEFYSNLYKISKHITRDPTAKIEIIGHTDVLASEKYNLDLSERRANAVYSILIELFKIPSKNLVTKYLGENQPLIEGLPEIKEAKLAPAYYLNRRVEFKIIK